MNTSSDIWFSFVKSFSMLFFVLALLILAFYLIKKFSMFKASKTNYDIIKVLAVHHLSPKEKLVLLNIEKETILIGVTPSNITKLSNIENPIDLKSAKKTTANFSDFLSKKLSKT